MSNFKSMFLKTILPILFVVSALLVLSILEACDNPAPTATPVPPTPSGGEAIFMRYCAVCHPGGHRAAGPDIRQDIADSDDEDLADVIRSGRDRMPPYDKSIISDVQLTELIAYLRTLK